MSVAEAGSISATLTVSLSWAVDHTRSDRTELDPTRCHVSDDLAAAAPEPESATARAHG